MPKWSADDQAFAKAAQTFNDRKIEPLKDEVTELSTPESRKPSTGGGSDDIGDIMWAVPTITIRFPSNIPNMIGHNSTAAFAMATPIAHKGVEAGAKAVAMTVLDLVTTPKLIADAKAYFTDVQLKTDTYAPVLTDKDVPAIWLNERNMQLYRPLMEKYYYNPAKHATYLDQLGIKYPTLTKPAE
jgi:aminobenzoyl-glutamate utilization protein B